MTTRLTWFSLILLLVVPYTGCLREGGEPMDYPAQAVPLTRECGVIEWHVN